jgi:hypothetical protein
MHILLHRLEVDRNIIFAGLLWGCFVRCIDQVRCLGLNHPGPRLVVLRVLLAAALSIFCFGRACRYHVKMSRKGGMGEGCRIGDSELRHSS